MKKTIFGLILASFLILLVACEKETEVSKYVAREPGEKLELSGKGYKKVAAEGGSILYVDPSTATIKWEDKASGVSRETRLFDSDVTDSTLKDDLIVYYYTGKASAKYSSYTSMDTYTYSLEMDGVSYESLPNGVRVIYKISNTKVTYKDFPAYIADDRFNDLIVQYLDDKQLKQLKKQYRQLQNGDWSRNANEANPIGGLSASGLYTIFYEVGHYTYEELEYDDTLYDKMDEYPQRQEIEVAMDYSLDEGDLIVHIDTSTIVYNSDFPVKSLSILPYFLSSNENDGYLFVPDGSGALIYFDNTKTQEYQFASRYWGGDVLQTATTYSTTGSKMMAPVYGIKCDDCAILGMIEDGAEVATLNAYISKSYNNVPYSRVSLSFAIREDQQLASFVTAVNNYSYKKVSTDYYSGDITIRYRMLTGDKADYCGMAEAYRDRLLETGGLPANTVEDSAPVFVELLGYIDATKYFLGIPYNGKTVITDYAAAQSILADMKERGIQNIKVDYKGMANGGMLQRSAEKVSLSSELGGKKAWNALASYAEANGIDLFPDFQLQTANTDKGLSKNERSFFINGSVAQIYDFDPVFHKTVDEEKDQYPTYIISPLYIREYIDSFAKSYSKLGLKNLASEDFYTFLGATYKKNENTSLSSAMRSYDEILNALSGDYRLLLSDPISKAWPKATYLTDLPFRGIGLKVVDAYVPFMELVLSGSTTYSSEVMNYNTYDMTDELMKAIEYGSAPKFRFIACETSELEETKAADVFLAEYGNLDKIVADMYGEYASFYEQIRGARLTGHELLDRDGGLVHTEWSNGVNIYFNYTDETAKIKGVSVEPMSYKVIGGR